MRKSMEPLRCATQYIKNWAKLLTLILFSPFSRQSCPIFWRERVTLRNRKHVTSATAVPQSCRDVKPYTQARRQAPRTHPESSAPELSWAQVSGDINTGYEPADVKSDASVELPWGASLINVLERVAYLSRTACSVINWLDFPETFNIPCSKGIIK